MVCLLSRTCLRVGGGVSTAPKGGMDEGVVAVWWKVISWGGKRPKAGFHSFV